MPKDIDLKSKKKIFRPLFNNKSKNILLKNNKKPFSFISILPNMTTLFAMCCGLTAIRFALLGMWKYSILCIMLSAILDAMDGRLARYLKMSSRFGAELDSFSDFLSFGVAPSLIIYIKYLKPWGEIGWVISVFFTMCMALRLARFNVMSLDESQPVWKSFFFTGVPAPLGGFLAIYPIILSYTFDESIISPVIAAFFLSLTGSLMVSQIPTFSLKKLTFKPSVVLPFILFSFITVGLLFSYPWQTLSAVGIIYLLSIPFSMRKFKKLEQQDLQTS